MKTLFTLIALTLSVNCAFCQIETKQPDTTGKRPALTPTVFSMHFDQVFKRNMDGSYSPLQPVMINGESMNAGTQLTAGVTFGGMDITAHPGHDLLVDTVKGVVIIRGFN